MAHPYCSNSEVRVKLKDYIKREVEDDLITQSIEEADTIIDSYLNRYYDITGFSSSIGIIKSISIMLAASLVTGSLYQDLDQSASTWESKLKNDAKDRLLQLQDNTLTVPTLSRIFC